MPTIDNVATALDAGKQLGDIHDKIDTVEGIPVALIPAGMQVAPLVGVLELADARAAAPKRRKGTATHQELESFLTHVKRFLDPGSVVFADPKSVKLLAVFDYHPIGASSAPRWGEHRSLYTCPLSKQWQRWLGQNEKPMTQDQFGAFIDDNMKDLASDQGPLDDDIAQPAKVLEMARKLSVIQRGEFRREVNVTTGESTLVNKVENDTQGTKIPRAFLLGIPVFESCTLYRVEARIRFSLQDGRAYFTYSLYHHEEILKDAFNEVRAKVLEQTGLPVFAGSPE